MEVKGVVHLDEIGIVEETKLADLEKIHSFIDKRNGEKSSLIPILFDIEAEYDCLPKNALEYVAKELGIQISELSSTIKRKKREFELANSILQNIIRNAQIVERV